MKILDRHISRTVLLAMVVVISLMGTLDLIFTLLDQIADTDESYSLSNALSYVLLTTPTSLYEMLPFTALGGALIGLGVLASNNELVVMQAAGVRTLRIVFAVLKPTFLVMGLSLFVGEYVSPSLEQTAKSNRAIQQSANASVASEQGNWQRIGNDFVHINAIAPGGKSLFGVTRYTISDDRRLLSASFAESARYIETPEENYWRLENIDESLLERQSVRSNHYLQEDWRVDLSPELLSVLLVEPDEQSISGLYRLANYFDSEGLDSSAYYLAFWKKLTQPIATLALVILAVSFVFGPLRESTTGFRVFVSISMGLLFTIAQRLMEPASLIYGFSPLLAVLLPIFICASLGFVFLRRVR
ncbi:MAG: LPS export ABC transporter permease LptG [Pseudohongiellaceae bacterium]